MKGFTLVEILVAIAIVAMVGMILALIFINTLRGSNKSQILSVIKQNGQAAMDTLDKTIRNADNVACISASGDTLAVVKNGIYTRFRFKNDYIEKENLSDFTATACSDPSVSPVTLTNTDPKTGVSVTDGSFASDSLPGYKTAVTINFKLGAGVDADQSISDPVEFKTTIGLR